MSNDTRFVPLNFDPQDDTSVPYPWDLDAKIHMVDPLWTWCIRSPFFRNPHEKYPGFSALADRLLLSIQVDVDDSLELYYKYRNNPNLLLQTVHFILGAPEMQLPSMSPSDIEDLDQILHDASSAWTVRLDKLGLQRRLSTAERSEQQRATQIVDPATQHLNAAIAAAWGPEENATEAYDEAVKALEAVLKPIVSPANDSTRLGTIVRDMRAKPNKWKLALSSDDSSEGVTVIAGLLDIVWTSHIRHAGDEFKKHTIEESRDAISIAVMIIGITRRKSLDIQSPQ